MTGLKPNLIYDVGLHRGEDTDYYLKKGFDVVALEANPELIAHCKIRFQDAIAHSRVRIIEGAIAPTSAGERVTFYRNKTHSDWSTIDEAWAVRNAKLGCSSETIELPRVDIGEVYRSLGIPFYLKIDVEGVDRLVLDGLKQFEARPRYLSIESEKVDFAELQAEISLLRDLGYMKFKPVQQASVPGTTIRTKTLDGNEMQYVFEPKASGPFGEDIPQPWLSFDETLREYESIFRLYGLFGDNSLLMKMPIPIQMVIRQSYRIWTGYRGPLPGWYDTHAAL
jgi:FkbM family methyltransferase